jgi:hypothetical protein
MFTGELLFLSSAEPPRKLTPLRAGLVVENFSYVYQTTGGAKAVTREEMRPFKKVWAEFANQKSGLLERSHLVPFFRVSNLLFLQLLLAIDSSPASSCRNWEAFLKFASIRLSIVSRTYWLLVGIRRTLTPSGNLAPKFPTALTSGC